MTDILQGAVHRGSAESRPARDALRAFSLTPNGALFSADYLHSLAREGRIFVASDADENDRVTGQTSFAATTPTFLLDVPNGTIAIPLWVSLVQAGSVAGGAITVYVSIDGVDRYSSGGTAEAANSTRTDDPTAEACTLYSGATAAAANKARLIDSAVLAEDVAPVSADAQNFKYLWTPRAPIYIVGDGAFMVFTYAASTGPTWEWSVGWAEIPESELN